MRTGVAGFLTYSLLIHIWHTSTEPGARRQICMYTFVHYSDLHIYMYTFCLGRRRPFDISQLGVDY